MNLFFFQLSIERNTPGSQDKNQLSRTFYLSYKLSLDGHEAIVIISAQGALRSNQGGRWQRTGADLADNGVT